MNSEQYSETPMPEGSRCPQCGEKMPANTQSCPRCAEKGAIQERKPKRRRANDDLRSNRSEPVGEGAEWAVMGFLVILLGIGLALAAPGLLVVLAILATPAVVRTVMASSREKDETGIAIPPSLLQVFFSSIAVAVVVGIAASTAFFAACFVTGFGAMAVTNSPGGLICGLVSGVVAALSVAVFLFGKFWARKD